MPPATAKSPLRQGLSDTAPFTLVVPAFGILFGVVAREAGLSLPETFGFSLLVIGGASQFAALQLMSENAPWIVALATALAVNLRMAMYAAALAPAFAGLPLRRRAVLAYFNYDQSFAAASSAFARNPGWTASERASYFVAVAAPVAVTWVVGSVVGLRMGDAMPGWLDLRFTLPLVFLALVAPMLTTVPRLVSALCSVVLALALGWVPAGLGLLIAGVCAMIAGAAAERYLERRSARRDPPPGEGPGGSARP